MRPRTLLDFVMWAHLESAASTLEPPDKLHTRSYADGDDPGHTGREAIRGLPFTRAFQRFLDGERPKTPVRRALAKMRARGERQSPEYRLCFAVVEGGQNSAHVQAVMRCSDAVVIRAFSTLYELTELEMANERTLSKDAKSVA